MMHSSKNYLLMMLIGSTLFISACGDKDKNAAESKDAKSETQVVAKVNDDEISIHQINFQLGRVTQGNQAQLNETQSKEAAKQILTRLVDQQLLKQKALESKLDRDPRVLQALEASKNEILAQAYLEQMMSKAAKPSSSEVDTFYKENPELFEKRRVFRIQELVVDIAQDKHAEVIDSIKDLKNINEIATLLKNKNYPFNANSNLRAAEQLPLELLKKIQPLKDGEFLAVPTARSLNIVHLAASQNMPITLDKATPIIQQYFLNKNKTELAKAEMLELNKKSTVEYVGAFADMKKSTNTNNGDIKSDKSDSIVEPSAQVKSVEPAKADTQSGVNESSLDKGLSGL